MFRLVAGLCRTVVVTNTAGSLALLIIFVMGGFILPRGNHPCIPSHIDYRSPCQHNGHSCIGAIGTQLQKLLIVSEQEYM